MSLPATLQISGLVCDMIGAVLVAVEVVNKFKGEQFKSGTGWDGLGKAPIPTDEYTKWFLLKNKVMLAGLIFLLAGFMLQIFGVISQESEKTSLVTLAAPTATPIIQTIMPSKKISEPSGQITPSSKLLNEEIETKIPPKEDATKK